MSQRHGAPLRLLSLDGGGIRGLSSLLILKSLFEMVAQLKGHPVMPHEIFDMISGTSTGGLIAVMLGPLSMDIQTCIDTYLAMAPEIFPTEGLVSGSKLHKMIGMFRGKNRFDPGPLETFLRRLVAERVGMRSGHGEDTTMQFEWTEATGEPHCKIFLCVTSEKFGGHFRLRSYHVPGDAIDCPIWQACRATSAAPTIFPPMRIGKPNDQAAFVDGGLGKNNPTLELIDEAKTVWQDKRDVGCVVSVGTGMMPMVDVRQNAKALVRSLAAMATDTQEVAKAVKLDMIRAYGPDQKVYHRFNVDHGLDGIGLEEWKEFSAVKVATQNYIQENMDKLKSCAAALVAPPRVGPPDQLPSLRPRFLVWADRLSTHFVGRETELASISSFFANPCSTRRRVAMYGLPGMGKSQLVYQYMATNMKRYNAVFFADATSVSTMSYAYVDIFKALKIPDLSNPPDQGTRINSVKDWLRRRKDWLLVFDNLQEADYNEWKTFLPYGDTGHIMITTRSEWVAKTFTGNYDGQCLRVEELDFESAPRLLLRAALLESRQEELRDLAKAIVEKLWYILLAIEFVGRGHQSEHLLRTVLAALENTSMRQDLEAKYSSRYGVLEYRDNPTTFLTLYAFEKLTPRTQEVWRVMAFLDPAWYSESLFQYIRIATGIPLGHLVSDRGQLRAAFEELLRTGIIQQVKGDDGYWTHDLIHEISRVFLKTESMDHDYAGFAASWLCSAFPDYSAFGKWHGDRYFLKHAETCVGFAEDLRLKTRDIQRLLFKASNFARFIGNYKAAERLARRSVNEFDSEAGAKPDLFAARDSLAIALRRQSRFSEARCILDQNLAEQRRILGDKDPGTLSTMNEIGYNWFLAGDADRARPILEEVKEGRLRVLGPGAGPTQHTFQNLAACLTRLGEYERAEELYKLARDGHEGLFGEDHHWVQHIRGNIAQLQEKQGRMQDALAGYRGVYEWRKANPNFGEDHPDTLRVAVSLTRVYHELGRDGDALSLGRRIRDTFLRIFGEDHPETKELDMLLYNVEGGRRQVAIRCYQSCQALAARSTQNQLVSPIAATLSLLRMWHQTGLSNSNGAITPSRIGSHGVSFQTQ